NAAMDFIRDNRGEPFLAYFSTNAPHSPLEVSEEYSAPYVALGLDEKTARVYGMITNIDENVGRVLELLRELDLDDNTIVIFLTDNGPCASQGPERFNAGLRDRKGTVYDGGIRVPCFVRWPARLEAGHEVQEIAAHIDVLPTVLDACDVPVPDGLRFDGVSLLPLMLGTARRWPDRMLYFQWHRGDAPELYRNCAARSQRFKLVNGQELYDMTSDPGESEDVAARHPDVVAKMRTGYEEWFAEVSAPPGYAPPRIHLGTPHEDPVTLTRQDWRGAEGWGDSDLGYWEVKVAAAGEYDVTLRFAAAEGGEEAHFRLGDVVRRERLEAGATSCVFAGVSLMAGDARLEAWLTAGGKPVGARYVDVERVPPGEAPAAEAEGAG
ncbi:MAG: sulfatase-like hydrolase/transferase, partial [Armatimonadota bacterium]